MFLECCFVMIFDCDIDLVLLVKIFVEGMMMGFYL